MKKIILAFGLAALSVGPALAQAANFQTADVNADGMVTMEEGNAAGASWTDEQFKAADADGDGSLSEAEYTAATGN
ncbi:MAG: hypothetical protein WBO55_02965 [Rhizobiaceae bacterium]